MRVALLAVNDAKVPSPFMRARIQRNASDSRRTSVASTEPVGPDDRRELQREVAGAASEIDHCLPGVEIERRRRRAAGRCHVVAFRLHLVQHAQREDGLPRDVRERHADEG